MTTRVIVSPPAITPGIAVGIIQRLSDHAASVTEPARALCSNAHYKLMAPLSDDGRLQYLGKAGCDGELIRLIAQAIAQSIGKAAKPALRAAARETAEAGEDIETLLTRWPEPQHFQLLNSKFDGLSQEQLSLAIAYAAGQIYETAATALYLAIVDSLASVATDAPSDAAAMVRDRAIADAGYTDEVARWVK